MSGARSKSRSFDLCSFELQDSQLKDVIDQLTKQGVSALEIEGIQRKTRDSCEITFKTQATLQKVTPSLSSDSTVDVETFGNGITMVTAVGIPVEMDDNFIRLRLKDYGVVVDGIFRTYSNLGIGQDIVSFRYVKQPKQCHRCGSEEHFVAACKADNRLALGTAWTKAPSPQAVALTLAEPAAKAGPSLVEGVSDSENESGGEESRDESSDSEEEETSPKGAYTPPKGSLPKSKFRQESDDTPASLKADESLPEDGANKMPETTPERTEPGDSLDQSLEESDELVIDECPNRPHSSESKRQHSSESEDSSDNIKKGKVKGKKTVVESDGESSQIELYPSFADDQQQKQNPPHSHRRRGGRNGHKP
ncbi:zinc finger protein [Branchiostoma belcheri]|nr:zinc finger protein [Branchiostoma belcheri]